MPAPSPSPAPAAEPWTTKKLLTWIVKALAERKVDSPRLCAELLLAHVLRCDRLELYMHAERPASPEERERLRVLVARAMGHEPVQYLVGEGWFFSLPFAVDRRVLIPRPSTETIVERVIQHARVNAAFLGDGPRIADIGAGSGCIAVALARSLPAARVTATDISEDALVVARANAARHGVADRIEFVAGNLLAPLAGLVPPGSLHYLVSNPPYIPDAEWSTPGMVGRNVKGHEPELALRGGADGLRFVGPLIEHGPALLRPGGVLLVECATSTTGAALALASRHPLLEDAAVVPDFEGLPRVLAARRRGPA